MTGESKALDCPFCDGAIPSEFTRYGDVACADCGLAGPTEVLEGLGRHIAALEAERDELRAVVERVRDLAPVWEVGRIRVAVHLCRVCAARLAAVLPPKGSRAESCAAGAVKEEP